MMNHHFRAVSATTMKNLTSPRTIPRRGQIKSRIAANALHSIAAILSKASLHHLHSAEKLEQRIRKA